MARFGTVLVALGVFALGLPAAAEAPQAGGLDAAGAASQPAPAQGLDDTGSDSATAPPLESSTSTASAEAGAASQPAEAMPSAEAPASMPAASSAASQPASRPEVEDSPRESEDATPDRETEAEVITTEPSVASTSTNALPAEVKERRVVALVAAGVATVALGAGIALGVVAQQRYQCLDDVVACNQTLEEPIVGDAFLEARAEVENLSLLADMSYVLAAGSTLVAITSFVRGFLLPVALEEVAP